ncbi:MAG: hypothetical protein RL681_265 [Candidatus Parcubacteria bacterium]|jgi:uncharacterized membrane protein YuzA (DUF378 family)
MTNVIRIKTDGIKFVLGWLTVLAIRLVPFRPPNVEPMFAVVMPFSKHYNAWGSFAFGVLGITAFDLMTGTIGMWTLITAAAYGLLGAYAAWFFRDRGATVKNFLVCGIVGTVLYDAVTGLSIGPIFFGQSITEAFVGQIPFTLMHVAGTAAFSVVLSPAAYRWIVTNPALTIPVGARVARAS